MKYKEIRIIALIFVVIGAIVIFTLFMLLDKCSYYTPYGLEEGQTGTVSAWYRIGQPELMFSLIYSMSLTFVVFIVIPILYIRKKNPKKLK